MEARIRKQYELQVLQIEAHNKEREQWDTVFSKLQTCYECMETLARLPQYKGLKQALQYLTDAKLELQKRCVYSPGFREDPVKETLTWIVNEAKKLEDPKAAAEQVTQMTLILSKMIQEPPGFDDA